MTKLETYNFEFYGDAVPNPTAQEAKQVSPTEQAFWDAVEEYKGFGKDDNHDPAEEAAAKARVAELLEALIDLGPSYGPKDRPAVQSKP